MAKTKSPVTWFPATQPLQERTPFFKNIATEALDLTEIGSIIQPKDFGSEDLSIDMEKPSSSSRKTSTRR